MDSVTCLRCGVVKPANGFYFRRDTKSGLASTCKQCMNWEASQNALGITVPPRRNGLDGMTRRCKKCNEAKPIEEFPLHSSSKDVRRTECKPCFLETHRERYRSNRSSYRDKMRRALYGLAPGEYEQMVAAQGGVCAVCGEEETSPDRRTGEPRGLFVDHCHTSGTVRGLLCMRCNIGVGQFRDDVELMKRAIEYLNRSAG